MTSLTLSEISSQLKSYGTHLENTTKGFHEGLLNYWKERDFFHHAITADLDNDGCLCAAMPAFKFYFQSRNRRVFSGKNIISEIEFFTQIVGDDKYTSLLKCYFRFTGEFTFETPDSPEVYDSDYDRSIEASVFGRIISAAYDKNLIAV